LAGPELGRLPPCPLAIDVQDIQGGRWAGLAGNDAPASSTRPYLSRAQAARAVSRKWVKNGTTSDSYDGYDVSVERGTLRDMLRIEPEPLLQ